MTQNMPLDRDRLRNQSAGPCGNRYCKTERRGFEALVESGQTVKKGDPMLKLDLEYLKANAPSITSPVLCTELEDNQRIHLLQEGQIKAGEPLFEIEVLQ